MTAEIEKHEHGSCMQAAASNSVPAVPLLVIVIGAFLLRAPGIMWGWGLSGDRSQIAMLHPDEERFVIMASELESHSLRRRDYVLGFGNILRMLYRWGMAARIPFSRSDLLLEGRLLSLCAGVLLVLIVVGITRDLFHSAWTALMAGLLVATNTLCTIHSHLCTADSLYCTSLYLFAWLTWRGIQRDRIPLLIAAAAIAGIAMGLKFGVVLLPSVVLLGIKYRRYAIHLWAVAGIFFFLIQGFEFGRENLRQIWHMFLTDNATRRGFCYRWNLPVYLVEYVRACGVPVVLVSLFLASRVWRKETRGCTLGYRHMVAFLPFILHAIGLLGLAVPFPRHLLPLVPLGMIVAARGLWHLTSRKRMAVVCVAWAAILSICDAAGFWFDARRGALQWIHTNVPPGTAVFVDRGFRVPLPEYAHPRKWYRAKVFIRHEAWTYRFRRSELHPFGPPSCRELYHASAVDKLVYRKIRHWKRKGRLRLVYFARPPCIMPEDFLYRYLWGSFNKFAGGCSVLVSRDFRGAEQGDGGAILQAGLSL